VYKDIGGKIKGLAKAVFIIATILSVVTGLFMILSDEDMLVVVGLFVIIAGPLVAYAFSWLLYGFGELIDTAYNIEWNTRRADEELEKYKILEQLLSRGVITEEQFRQEISEE